MGKRTTRTELVVLGTEEITGKKSDVCGRLSEPVAKIDLIKRDITISPEADVGKLIFLANVKYQEEAIVIRDYISTQGVPKNVKYQLRKKGISEDRIKRLEFHLKTLDLSNLSPAKTYLKFSRDLLKLYKALKSAEI